MNGEIDGAADNTVDMGENNDTDVGENGVGRAGVKLELLGENVDVGFIGGVAMLAKVVDDVMPIAGAGLP